MFENDCLLGIERELNKSPRNCLNETSHLPNMAKGAALDKKSNYGEEQHSERKAYINRKQIKKGRRKSTNKQREE